ncbi:hypothetical protein NE237_028935 [Protea cynaroides]|uniref:Uncharacterized protein n=1 Tax=Protea cynaroides TaxID=273540 RepID=A0A9Q0GSZ5_9MAGN|nr:hypothetical protein NE237_028935 [Protea cynaroides]
MAIFETTGKPQVDVHYVTAGVSGRVEENFEGFYLEHGDLSLEEVLQVQETVHMALRESNGNDRTEASGSGSSKVNHGQSSGEKQEMNKERESLHVADVESQLALDEALAISLQELENQLLISSLSESTGTEAGSAVNREDNSASASTQVVRQDNIDPDSMTYEELQSLGEAVGTANRGLSEELISYLPTSKYKTGWFFSKKDEVEECVICCMEYKNHDKLITLPCQHQYHSKCVSRWLKQNKACPVCNEDLTRRTSREQRSAFVYKKKTQTPSPPPLSHPVFLNISLHQRFSFYLFAPTLFFLSLCTQLNDGGYSPPKTGLGDLPESCVASILMNLDPPDICKFARLNRAFRGASSADFVWESKLPSNYRYLVEKLFDKVPVNLSKKDIYARLCQPNSFDCGTKEAWLDRNSGGIVLSISSKALRITGIDDRRYWNHIPTEESRFHTVAYLHQIWWFEVGGEVEFCFPVGTYSLFFRLQLGRASKRLGRRICNPEHVHGWDIKPVGFQVSTSDGQCAQSQCYLSEPGNWNHYYAGDFVVEYPNVSTKIKFSMTQIDCTHTKGGLCVDSVFVCPSGFRESLKRF